MEWVLMPIYIGTAIFGIGVTIIDMMGFIGNNEGEGDAEVADGIHGEDIDGDFDGDGDFDHDADFDHDGDADHADDFGDDGDADADVAHGDDDLSKIAHDSKTKKNPLLSLLSLLRSAVYFSMGFGPVGIVAILVGYKGVTNLFWSVPVGVIALIITRSIRKIQANKLDSQLKDSELIMAEAEVIVSIKPGMMGKVRVKLDRGVSDRYARAEEQSKGYPVGSKVRVVNISEECLFVSDKDFSSES